MDAWSQPQVSWRRSHTDSCMKNNPTQTICFYIGWRVFCTACCQNDYCVRTAAVSLNVLRSYWSIICFPVMRRNPFMVEGCCRKGSRNALQELYNPTQVGHCPTSISALVISLSPPASVFTFVFYSRFSPEEGGGRKPIFVFACMFRRQIFSFLTVGAHRTDAQSLPEETADCLWKLSIMIDSPSLGQEMLPASGDKSSRLYHKWEQTINHKKGQRFFSGLTIYPFQGQWGNDKLLLEALFCSIFSYRINSETITVLSCLSQPVKPCFISFFTI